MVWKQQEHNKVQQHGSYYQKLMPGHFVSHLIHHPGQQQHDSSQPHKSDNYDGRQQQTNGMFIIINYRQF